MTTSSTEPGRQYSNQSARNEVHLRDYLAIVSKRLSVIIVTAVVVFVFVALPEAQKPRTYRTSASLLVKPPSRSFIDAGGVTYYLMSKQDFDQQVYLLKGKKVALEVIDAVVTERFNADLLHELGYFATEPPSESQLQSLANAFRSRLTVTPMAETNIINLSLVGTEPMQIQRLLRLFCDHYVQFNGRRDREHLEANKLQLDELIPDLQENFEQKINEKKQLIQNSPYSQLALQVEKDQLEKLGSELVEQSSDARVLDADLDRFQAVLLDLPMVANNQAVRAAQAALEAHATMVLERQRLQRDADVFGHSLIELLEGMPGAGKTLRAYRNASAGQYKGGASGSGDSTSRVRTVPDLVQQDTVRSRRSRARFEELREQAEEKLLGGDYTGAFLGFALARPQIAERWPGGESGERTLGDLHGDYLRAEQDLEAARDGRQQPRSGGGGQARIQELQTVRRQAESVLADGLRAVLRTMVAERRVLSEGAANLETEIDAAGEDQLRSALIASMVDAIRDSMDEIVSTRALADLMGLTTVLKDDTLGRLQEELQQQELAVEAAIAQAERLGLAEGGKGYNELVADKVAALAHKRTSVVDQVVRLLKARALERQSLQKSLATLQRRLASQIDLVSQIELTQADFERAAFRITTAQDLLGSAVKEQQRVQFDAKLRENNVSLVEEPRQPDPSAYFEPDIRRAMLMGAVFGIVAGFGLAFVLEYLDDTIKTASDIDRYISAPILGAIPTMVGKNAGRRDLISFYEPKASISEAFRSVRTSLLFASSDARRDTFVVTSVGPQEGKTTVSLNLAVTLAQSGSRTLLVDCDLRRPRVHKAFGFRENLGLTNILVGGGTVEEYARPTDVPNLHLLTSGPIPPNPSELIGSASMRDFFAELRTKYDKIIYDTPPLAAVTDGVILGGMVDGLILVISSAKTTKKLAQRAREQLDNVGVTVFGVVLNNVKASHGYYYYSSYYRYYGEESSKA